MEDHYEINVAFNGWHLFATAPRSVITENDLKKVLNIIVQKFPEKEGYSISVRKWEARGYTVDIGDVLGG